MESRRIVACIAIIFGLLYAFQIALILFVDLLNAPLIGGAVIFLSKARFRFADSAAQFIHSFISMRRNPASLQQTISCLRIDPLLIG